MELLNKWLFIKGETSELDAMCRIYKYDGKEYKAVMWHRCGGSCAEWFDVEDFNNHIDITDICLNYLEKEELDPNDFQQGEAFEIFSMLEMM